MEQSVGNQHSSSIAIERDNDTPSIENDSIVPSDAVAPPAASVSPLPDIKSKGLVAADEDYKIEGKQFGFIMSSLLIAIFLASLDNTIVSVCLPSILKDFNAASTDYSWIISSYILASTCAAAVSGRLSDRFSRRTVMIGSVAIFLVGSALCGAAQSSTQLIIFRAVQGIGGGPLITMASVILGDLVTPLQRGKWAGLIGATFTVASAIGPVIGGGFTDSSAGWRWAFFINIPISGIALLFMIKYLRYQQRSVANSVDIWGMLLISGCIVSLMLAVTWGGAKYAWSHAIIVSTFEAFGFFAILFIIVQQKYAADPTIPLRLFKIRNISVCSAASFFLMFCFLGVLSYVNIHFQIVKGISAVNSGLKILPSTAGLLLGSVISGAVVSKTGKYRGFPIFGTALLILGCYLLSTLDVTSSVSQESGYLFIFGLAIGFCMQTLQVVSQAACDIKDIAVTTTAVRFLQNIGGTIGTSVVGSIFSNRLKDNFAGLGFSTATSGHGEGSFAVDLSALSDASKLKVYNAYSDALSAAFQIAIIFAALSFVFACMLKNVPLRDSFKEKDEKVSDSKQQPAEQELKEIASVEPIEERQEVNSA